MALEEANRALKVSIEITLLITFYNKDS